MDMVGVLFLAGAVAAFIGFFSPFAATIYGRLGRPDALEERVAYIEAHRFWWHEHNIGFAIGAPTVALGFILLADDALAWVAAAAAAAGAVAATTFAIKRTLVHDLRAWFTGDDGRFLFPTFTVLTITAFVLLAVDSFGTTTWLAAFLVAWNVLLVAVLVVLRDLPPFTHYVGATVVGIALLV